MRGVLPARVWRPPPPLQNPPPPPWPSSPHLLSVWLSLLRGFPSSHGAGRRRLFQEPISRKGTAPPNASRPARSLPFKCLPAESGSPDHWPAAASQSAPQALPRTAAREFPRSPQGAHAWLLPQPRIRPGPVGVPPVRDHPAALGQGSCCPRERKEPGKELRARRRGSKIITEKSPPSFLISPQPLAQTLKGWWEA